MKSSEYDILPCPFCGGKAELRYVGTESCHVVCTKCECTTPLFYKKLSWCAIDKAIEIWNSRVKPYFGPCDTCVYFTNEVDEEPCCECCHAYADRFTLNIKGEAE